MYHILYCSHLSIVALQYPLQVLTKVRYKHVFMFDFVVWPKCIFWSFWGGKTNNIGVHTPISLYKKNGHISPQASYLQWFSSFYNQWSISTFFTLIILNDLWWSFVKFAFILLTEQHLFELLSIFENIAVIGMYA